MASEPLQAFTHAPIRTDTRLMILSVCIKCGFSKLVSVQDGSLEKWETGHKCKNQSQSDLRSSPEGPARAQDENRKMES
jgi:predicted  nucleic acid-binding Zn-ribbon protein